MWLRLAMLCSISAAMGCAVVAGSSAAEPQVDAGADASVLVDDAASDVRDTAAPPSLPAGAVRIVTETSHGGTSLTVELLRALPVDTPPVVVERSGACVVTPDPRREFVESVNLGNVVTAEIDSGASVSMPFIDGRYAGWRAPRLPSGSVVRVRVAADATRAEIVESVAISDLRLTTPSVVSPGPNELGLVPHTPGLDLAVAWTPRADGFVTLEIVPSPPHDPSGGIIKPAPYVVRCTAAASAGSLRAPWSLVTRHLGGSGSGMSLDSLRIDISYTRTEDRATGGVSVRTVSDTVVSGRLVRR